MVHGKSVRLSKKSTRRGSKIERKSFAGLGDSEGLGNLDEIRKQGDIISKKFEQLLKKTDVKDSSDLKNESVKGT